MLPVWREKFSPDVVIANIENIAHGKGIGISQINELRGVGVQIFTGGNHSFEGKNSGEILNDETIPITRPANVSSELPGRGVVIYEVKSEQGTSETESAKNENVHLLIINLIGQVHMRQSYDSPFHKVDEILEKYKNETQLIVVDWHAEATSEKEIMGWYLDGKVSAVLGTHTHVPTADERILPKGTAYISDIGMVGPHNSIIGVEVAPAIPRFKNQIASALEVEENGPIEINAVLIEISEVDSSEASKVVRRGGAVDIKRLREILE